MKVNEIVDLARQRFPECKILVEKCDFRDTHKILISVEGYNGFLFRVDVIENIFDLVKVLEGASVFVKYYIRKRNANKNKKD